MGIFDLALKIKGFPLNRAELELQSMYNMDLDSFRNNQLQKRDACYNYHRSNNSHYNAFCSNKEFLSWDEIPILTKESIQKPLHERLSNGYTSKNTYLSNTSGSSGEPFHFAKDKFCHAMTWAIIKNRFARHGLDFNHSLQARFYGIPLDSKMKYWAELLKDYLCRRKRFPIFDLSDSVLEKYLNEFRSREFNYLNGYTNALVLFADFLIRKEIVLKTICPSLQKCVTTSEILDPLDRRKIEKSFGVPVVNEYGASELDLIAFEDEDYDWILNEESLYIEILDENGKALPDGEEGRIVVTSLYNKAMPFIRYDVGDIGIISKKRKGHYRVLEKLIGRTNDTAILPSGKTVHGLTFYYVSKSMLEESGLIKEFIIKQVAPDHFHFEYVSFKDLNNSDIEGIRQLMDIYLEKNLKTTFERKIELKRTRAGKLKHFSVVYT